MKKLLIFLLIIVSFESFGQNPSNYTWINGRYRWQATMADSGLHFPRYSTTPVGLRVGVSPNSGAVGIDTINQVALFYSNLKWRNFGSQGFETRLVHGGQVTWDSLLVFSVAPAIYYINGAYYTSSQTYLTLDAADGSNDRIDLIYLDSTGAHKETGVPSATPQEPSLPANSIRLTAISVPTSSTIPGGGVDTVTVYDENVEWVVSSTSLTVVADDNVAPYHFVKAVQTAAITNASILKFTSSTDVNISSFTTLRFYLKLKAVFAPNCYLTVYFVKAGVKTCIPIEIKNGTYGFNRSTTNYQQITIPIADFAFTSSIADGLWFQPSASNASGFYMDWVQLQGGIALPPSGSTITNAYTRITDGTTTAAALGPDIFKVRANLPLRVAVGSDDATHGDNILASVDTSRALANSLATNDIVKKITDSIAALGGGEVNTASNLSGNGVGIWKDKSGVDLRFKRLKAGAGISVTDNTDSVTIAFSNTTKSKGLTIEFPSATEAIDMWQTPVAITVTSLKAILRGSSSPSITYNIKFGTDITSATDVFTSDITCTSVTTGCSNSSGFNDATIPAGSFIWVVTTAQSGTVTSIGFTINYTED